MSRIHSICMYIYCANNPVIYVDPSGHFAIPLLWVGKVILAAAASVVIGGITTQSNKLKKIKFKKL